jgi:hypothetical protein
VRLRAGWTHLSLERVADAFCDAFFSNISALVCFLCKACVHELADSVSKETYYRGKRDLHYCVHELAEPIQTCFLRSMPS